MKVRYVEILGEDYTIKDSSRTLSVGTEEVIAKIVYTQVKYKSNQMKLYIQRHLYILCKLSTLNYYIVIHAAGNIHNN